MQEIEKPKQLIDLFQISDELIKNNLVTLKNTSWCMFPTLVKGDKYKVKPCKAKDIQIGDIAVFRKNNKLYSHRVIKIGEDFIETKPDNTKKSDGKIFDKDILGKIISITRHGKKLDPKNTKDYHLPYFRLIKTKDKIKKKPFLYLIKTIKKIQNKNLYQKIGSLLNPKFIFIENNQKLKNINDIQSKADVIGYLFRQKACQAKIKKENNKFILKNYNCRIRFRGLKIKHKLKEQIKRLNQPLKKQKVFGIGFWKTGTQSLNKALNILGYKSTRKYGFIKRNLTINKDSVLFKHYNAFTMPPVAKVYKQLDKAFPDSKFILTIRDDKSRYKSMKKHLIKNILDKNNIKKVLCRNCLKNMNLFKKIILAIKIYLEKTDKNLCKRCQNKIKPQRYKINNKRFRKHIKEVKQYFNKDKLLIMDICNGNGWQKLCEFLKTPIPKQRFPKENITSKKITLNILRTIKNSILK